MNVSTRVKEWANSAYFAFGLFVISVFGVIFILISTSPAGLGATGMLFAFSVFYILFFAVFLLILHFLQFIFTRTQIKTGNDNPRPTHIELSVGRRYGVSITLAFAPVILIALRSIGQLDAMSAVLVAVFEIVAIFYILKR